MPDIKKKMKEGGIKVPPEMAEKEVNEILSGTYDEEKPSPSVLKEEVKANQIPSADATKKPEFATTPPSKYTYKEDAKTDPAVEKFFHRFTKSKEEGKVLHKSGKYDDAIEKYKACLKSLNDLRKKNTQGIKEEEFLLREVTTNSNIAVCYKQKQDSSEVIEYATKVIDSSIMDFNLKLKAYSLRAFAYEEIDKVSLAKEDWTKIKQMEPGNLKASKGLTRIQGAIEKDNVQKISDTMGEALKSLDAIKKKGNDFFKAGNIFKYMSQIRGL